MAKRSRVAFGMPVQQSTINRIQTKHAGRKHKYVKLKGRTGKGSRVCTHPNTHRPKKPRMKEAKHIRFDDADMGPPSEGV